MESIPHIIEALNTHLQEDWADEKRIFALVKELSNNGINCIRLLDFKIYNAEMLKFAKQEKARCVQELDFERAANMRDIERICIEYEVYMKQHYIVSSQFKYSDGEVFFCYLAENQTSNMVIRLTDKMRIL